MGSTSDHHTAAVLKLLVNRIRATWPNVRITIRGDGGFARWRLLRWCDHNDIRYIFVTVHRG
ncbi:MAG: transposase [Bacteroidales bacterium]|nr:transposase [Bacteroidales bacterium]